MCPMTNAVGFKNYCDYDSFRKFSTGTLSTIRYPDLYPIPTTNICESCYIHFGGVWPHTNSLKSEMLENSGHSEYHPFSDFFFCKTVQY